MRDHLFVSHASEDDDFAEWLTLKLTAEGYKVWCDHVKLLGGESYPKDIDKAIKNQTFRFLALMSRSSLFKPNPLKERTLALNIAKERENFVIPLNVDGLTTKEIDWMTSDIIFIPFHHTWFSGLEQLLTNLSRARAPRTAVDGRAAVREWYEQIDVLMHKPEQISSNLVPITEIPKHVYKCDVPSEIDSGQLLCEWPFYLQDATTAWSFQVPAPPMSNSIDVVDKYEWSKEQNLNGMKSFDLTSAVIRRSMEHLCLRKGLVRSQDRRHLYFKSGLTPDDRLRTEKPVDSRRFVKSIGMRRYKTLADGIEKKETSLYHLSPQFKPFLARFSQPVMAMRIYVFWTDFEGRPRSPRKAFRLRRKLARTWYNEQWFRRQTAILGWLTDWEPECTVVATPKGNLKIKNQTLTTTSPLTIDEAALAQYVTDIGVR